MNPTLQLFLFASLAFGGYLLTRYLRLKKENVARYGDRPIAWKEVRTLRGTSAAATEMTGMLSKLKSVTDQNHAKRAQGAGQLHIAYDIRYPDQPSASADDRLGQKPLVRYLIGGDKQVMRLVEGAFETRSEGIELRAAPDPNAVELAELRAKHLAENPVKS